MKKKKKTTEKPDILLWASLSMIMAKDSDEIKILLRYGTSNNINGSRRHIVLAIKNRLTRTKIERNDILELIRRALPSSIRMNISQMVYLHDIDIYDHDENAKTRSRESICGDDKIIKARIDATYIDFSKICKVDIEWDEEYRENMFIIDFDNNGIIKIRYNDDERFANEFLDYLKDDIRDTIKLKMELLDY